MATQKTINISNYYIKKNDIVDNLTTNDATKVLSGKQGKVLNDNKEDKTNKVTSWSSTTTDSHYPSEKLVKSSLNAKQDLLSNSTYAYDTFEMSIFDDDGNHFYGMNNRIYHDYGDTNSLYFIDSHETEVNFDDLAVKDDIPTKTSDLSNDSNFLTSHQDISGKAPNNHASSATTYGVATTSKYGHVKVADNLTTSSFDASQPVVLSAYQGKKLKSYIDTMHETRITPSSYDVQIGTDITITVLLMDAYGNALSNTCLTLLCNKGYFNNDTTIQSITATTDSNGKITATWTASEWGLCTFRTRRSQIQVNVTGWKEIKLTNATLYVNGYSRICELAFIKTMNVTTSYSTVETYSIIANNYPPLGNIYTATYSPSISVMLKANGLLQVKGESSVNNASVQGSMFWHY